MTADRRFPAWVYREGDEPDPRFSLANERTLLAWIRTALGLLGLAAAALAIDVGLGRGTQVRVALLLGVAGGVALVLGWTSWARAERRMRRGEPLPGAGASAALTGVLLLALVAVSVTARGAP